jgi:hypothetical protein
MPPRGGIAALKTMDGPNPSDTGTQQAGEGERSREEVNAQNPAYFLTSASESKRALVARL